MILEVTWDKEKAMLYSGGVDLTVRCDHYCIYISWFPLRNALSYTKQKPTAGLTKVNKLGLNRLRVA